MASNKTRLAVIISQENFELPGVEDRKGNAHDVNLLDSTLKEFGFFVRIYEDQNKQDILGILKGIALETHKNLECILVIVLSHGDSGGVIFAKDEEFYTKDVWGPFRDSAKLSGIPKVFIFQACRGRKQEKTIHPDSTTEPQNFYVSQTVPVLPQQTGFLLAHSTIADHTSKRNLDSGTIFIQTLCNEMSVFHNKYGEINFLSLLTEVNNKVATTAVGEQGSQTSTFTSFLRQLLILKTKHVGDVEKSPTSQISDDAQGGIIKTSYGDEGSRVLLILYTAKFEEQYERLNQILNHQYFTLKSILVNNIGDIYGLSRRNNVENACSVTVIVLAEMSACKITDYCEKIPVRFSTFVVSVNDIWYQFTASQCDHLRGKPKLFFFFDLHERNDSPEMDSHQGFNIEPVNNHSDFIWTYCYGKRMFAEITRALTESCEEITQLLTTAMRRADSGSTACSQGGRSSHFESTLRLQFYYRSSQPFVDSRKNAFGDTELHIAARKGQVETMQLILQRDRSLLNMQDEYGFTPLHYACRYGKTEAGKFLLSHTDCSVNICDNSGNTVLHSASREGHVETMQLILQRDRSLLNMQSKIGSTPLHYACYYGKTEAVKFLLSHTDCSVNICDNSGNTVLHSASREGHVETMQLILQRDRSLLNMQDEYGFTPLHNACYNGKTEAVKFLLSHTGCSVNICDKYGDTVLHYASHEGHVEIMQLILQRDRSPLNMQKNDGSTPLHYACYYGKTEAVKFLLSHTDCSVNICDKDGDTVLHNASHEGHVEIMQLILQRDRSPLNMQNNDGSTPLHYACYYGKTEAVKFLLSQTDSLVNVRDNSRRTALKLARMESYDEIIKLLRQHGAENTPQCTCM